MNIGGTVFTTTKQTLTSPFAKGSMLEAMFSGRHNIRRNKKGQVFIDRDSTFFRHVLNFLRTGRSLRVCVFLFKHRDFSVTLVMFLRYCVVPAFPSSCPTQYRLLTIYIRRHRLRRPSSGGRSQLLPAGAAQAHSSADLLQFPQVPSIFAV